MEINKLSQANLKGIKNDFESPFHFSCVMAILRVDRSLRLWSNDENVTGIFADTMSCSHDIISFNQNTATEMFVTTIQRRTNRHKIRMLSTLWKARFQRFLCLTDSIEVIRHLLKHSKILYRIHFCGLLRILSSQTLLS